MGVDDRQTRRGYTHSRQEAQLSQRDRATRYVSWLLSTAAEMFEESRLNGLPLTISD